MTVAADADRFELGLAQVDSVTSCIAAGLLGDDACTLDVDLQAALVALLDSATNNLRLATR